MFILFSCLYLLPVLLSAAIYYFTGRSANWRAADRSSAQLLAPPEKMPSAVVRVFSARTVSWRGIIATHSWIVIKEEGAPKYERFDYTAWGLPIWKDRFVPDGRWFGSIPEVIFAAEGAAAARMIPKIRTFIRHYRYSRPGDYRIWPGPNSNTFVAAIMRPCRACARACRRRPSARTFPTTAAGSISRRQKPDFASTLAVTRASPWDGTKASS
jgi:hypothetical protein